MDTLLSTALGSYYTDVAGYVVRIRCVVVIILNFYYYTDGMGPLVWWYVPSSLMTQVSCWLGPSGWEGVEAWTSNFKFESRVTVRIFSSDLCSLMIIFRTLGLCMSDLEKFASVVCVVLVCSCTRLNSRKKPPTLPQSHTRVRERSEYA